MKSFLLFFHRLIKYVRRLSLRALKRVYKRAGSVLGVDLLGFRVPFSKVTLKVFLYRKLISPADIQIIESSNEQEVSVAKGDGSSDICLIRIIGNDLPGLHDEAQSLENLEFILKHESDFPNLKKVFLLNRIVSQVKRNKIKALLDRYEASYFEEPFRVEEYARVPLCDDDLPSAAWKNGHQLTTWESLCLEVAKRKLRNSYLMNNNGARNLAISFGKKNGYDWIMPWDGNCFLSDCQFKKIQAAMRASLDRRADYLIVPMSRCLENDAVISGGEPPETREEPQIIFRSSAKCRFSKERVYGNQPKVELLKRLGVPGPWDSWQHEYPWKKFKVQSENASWLAASSVYRLSSGNLSTSSSAKSRTHARSRAIISFTDDVFDFSQKRTFSSSKADYLYYRQVERDNFYSPSRCITVNDVFDKVYLVSLEKDKEKRFKVASQLHCLGIDFEWVEAVNGYEGQPFEEYLNYKDRPLGELKNFTDHSQYEIDRGVKLIESPGAIGYIYTYTLILTRAKKQGLKNVLILEDDIVFCDCFNQRFDRFIRSVNPSWKVLHLASSQYGWGNVDCEASLAEGHFFPRIHDTKGSFAIAFDESVYDEIIESQAHLDAPFDNLPLGEIYEKYLQLCFVAYPFLVMPDVTVSSIRDGRTQLSHANRVGWWVPDFEFPSKRPVIGLVVPSTDSISQLGVDQSSKLPFDLSLFTIDPNGVSPLHLSVGWEADFSGGLDSRSLFKEVNLPLDLCLEVSPDFQLTNDLLSDAVLNIFGGGCSEGVNKVDIGNAKRVKDRVSVIIPTYKRPSHLRAAIESVLSQDYGDVELIVVDDNGVGSPFSNETRSLVMACAREHRDRIVKYVQHVENANGSAARNTGFLRSSGEYVCFLDDDDVYLPGRLRSSVDELARSGPETGAVYCGFLGWNSPQLDKCRFAEGDLSKYLLQLDYGKHYLHTNTATYRASAILRINGFNQSYRRHQDLEFNIRFFQAYRIGVVKQALVRLAPEKSVVDNKLYGIDMFELKKKFLTDFERVISKFTQEGQRTIYTVHWNEAIKYSRSDTEKAEVAARIANEKTGYLISGKAQPA